MASLIEPGKVISITAVFGIDGLIALQAELPVDKIQSYARGFGDGEHLDLVHLCCLARVRAAAGVQNEKSCCAIIQRIEQFRSRDGGFNLQPDQLHGTVYASFLAFGAYQDLGCEMPDALRMVQCLKGLETKDGAWANDRRAKFSSTSATAAAVTLLRNLSMPVNASVGDWLLARHHPQGGFVAAPEAPMPDLLSTATSFARARRHGRSTRDCPRGLPRFYRYALDEPGRFPWSLGRRIPGLRIHLLRVARSRALEFVSTDALAAAFAKTTRALLDERQPGGYWTGKLSSSALSTATAVCALAIYRRHALEPAVAINPLIFRGLDWLARQINPDGGWGDTDMSISNLSTTALCWAAFGAAERSRQYSQTRQSRRSLSSWCGGRYRSRRHRSSDHGSLRQRPNIFCPHSRGVRIVRKIRKRPRSLARDSALAV